MAKKENSMTTISINEKFPSNKKTLISIEGRANKISY
jgi:hypothetical protein